MKHGRGAIQRPQYPQRYLLLSLIPLLKNSKELEDIKQMMKSLIPTTTSRRECKTKRPFTDRSDVVPLPGGFVLPQFTQFSGAGDPIKHLQGFLAKMTITSNNPDIYAKAFSNSLSDKALD
ncbi:hypothetical protein LIER_24012 [Lithospermum erythrorhizon]|uniref:Uncharacterized protein n=1 Tax=Lithospermum erythrorhizon TaxID=34254 RepID=A0AAV3R2R9_LITER